MNLECFPQEDVALDITLGKLFLRRTFMGETDCQLGECPCVRVRGAERVFPGLGMALIAKGLGPGGI